VRSRSTRWAYDADGPAFPSFFARLDESDDAAFYAVPRLVVHVDEATLAALTRWYGEVLAPGIDVLDLMSSWVSHLPAAEALPLGRVVGLGMNAAELAGNPRLRAGRGGSQRLRLPIRMPLRRGAVRGVDQYLTRPVEVFRRRRGAPAGGCVAIATSERCFPRRRSAPSGCPAPPPRVIAAYLSARRPGCGAWICRPAPTRPDRDRAQTAV
jgi:hypothetical protein